MNKTEAIQYIMDVNKYVSSIDQIRNTLFISFSTRKISNDEFNLLNKTLDEIKINDKENTFLDFKKFDLETYDAEIKSYELLCTKFNFRDIIELDFLEYPNLNYRFYKNGKYLGDKDNPYLYLIQGIADEKGNFELHPDCKLICEKAFVRYCAGNKHDYTFKKIIIPGEIEYNLFAFGDLYVEELYLYSDSEYYYWNFFDSLKGTKFIYAPEIDFSRISYTYVKNLLIAGYIKFRNIDGYKWNKEEEYMSYLSKKYKNFYKNLENDILFDYLTKNNLIDKNDLYDLLKTIKNKEILVKLDEYSKTFNLDITNEKEFALKLFEKQIKINENVGLITTNKTRNTNLYNKYEKIKVNTPYMRKVQTYWRSHINVDDIFYCMVDDECILLKVVDKGKAYSFDYKLQILDDNEAKSILLSKPNMIEFDEKKYNKLVKVTNKIPVPFDNNFIYTQQEIYSLHDYISLPINLGVFKYIIFDDKLIELPDLQNNKTIYLQEKLLNLFEPYFELQPFEDSDYTLYFRKLNLNHIEDQLYHIPNVLMGNVMDLRASLMHPYSYIKNVKQSFRNEGGKIYPIIDLIKFINRDLTIGKNDSNLNIIQKSFSKFYQQYSGTNYEGFSKKDIVFLLNKYFVFDYALGFYYGWDTLEEVDNDLLCYDRRWFRVFYDTVRKNKKVELHSCDEIDNLINYNKVLEFNKYVIDDKYCQFFIDLARNIDSFEKFIDIMKPYLLKIINLEK